MFLIQSLCIHSLTQVQLRTLSLPMSSGASVECLRTPNYTRRTTHLDVNKANTHLNVTYLLTYLWSSGPRRTNRDHTPRCNQGEVHSPLRPELYPAQVLDSHTALTTHEQCYLNTYVVPHRNKHDGKSWVFRITHTALKIHKQWYSSTDVVPHRNKHDGKSWVFRRPDWPTYVWRLGRDVR